MCFSSILSLFLGPAKRSSRGTTKRRWNQSPTTSSVFSFSQAVRVQGLVFHIPKECSTSVCHPRKRCIRFRYTLLNYYSISARFRIRIFTLQKCAWLTFCILKLVNCMYFMHFYKRNEINLLSNLQSIFFLTRVTL